MKDKIHELAMNSKNKKIRDLYRGINEFKRGYQPRNSLLFIASSLILSSRYSLFLFVVVSIIFCCLV
jgi:hypothetical protein